MKTNYKKRLLNFTSILSVGFIAVSCSGFLPDRSYIEEMNRESDPYFVAGKDFKVVSGDTGEAYRSKSEISKRTPASERSSKNTKESQSLREELIGKEMEMSEDEMGQYNRDKRFLPTDSDKLYYLSLAKSERATYLNSRKLDLQEDSGGKRQDFIQKHSVHSAEIYLGMDKDQVMQTWGKPAKVDIAGNPKNQNERWSFYEDGNIKQVFFESGKVQGWALDL